MARTCQADTGPVLPKRTMLPDFFFIRQLLPYDGLLWVSSDIKRKTNSIQYFLKNSLAL